MALLIPSRLRSRLNAYRETVAGAEGPSWPENWKDKLGNWQVYAAAAGSALAMASSASAGTITYGVLGVTASITPLATGLKLNSVNRLVNSNVGSRTQLKSFMVNGAKLAIAVQSFRVPNTHSGSANAQMQAKTNGVNGFVTQMGSLAKLASGAKISQGNVKFLSTHGFVPGGLAFEDGNHGMLSGNFAPSKTGFAGFGIHTAGGSDFFGWIRLEYMVSSRGPDKIEAIDYAVNTVAGASITAGQGATSSAAPEPSTAAMALLATGAAGVLALRRRRAQAN